MQVIDEDHFTQAVVHGAGSYTFPGEKAYTRYINVLVRTLVDPTNLKDIDEVHALQDMIKVSQSSSQSLRSAGVGSGKPEEASRRAAGAWRDRPGYKAHVRHQKSGRSRAAPDRNRLGLGWPS
jgi:hypothetical protein